MTGFEPDVSDFGSNGAVNFATTTAQFVHNTNDTHFVT